jgi:orotate phosphoribosyltransferase
MRFHDRIDAGRQLADKLTKYAGRSDVLVLGLPRGGVPVAYEVATELRRRLTYSSSANLVCQAIQSSRWAPSPRVALRS